jgi:putative tricarboxylic transport membrane protein
MRALRCLACACAWAATAACVAVPAWAQDWKPTKPMEVIVGTPPGGPLDATARLIQTLLDKANLGVPSTVQNKPGGGHAIAMTYLNQRGDGHTVSMALTNLITNRIVGSHPLTYTDITPLALLTSEYIGMSVRTDAPG